VNCRTKLPAIGSHLSSALINRAARQAKPQVPDHAISRPVLPGGALGETIWPSNKTGKLSGYTARLPVKTCRRAIKIGERAIKTGKAIVASQPGRPVRADFLPGGCGTSRLMIQIKPQ
jgi:hypothetical protein